MASRLYSITVDARDPRKLAGFWAEVLGYERTFESEEGDEEYEVVLSPVDGSGNDILFGKAADEKSVKNRIHFDLAPTDQAAEVERVLGLGATKVDIGQGEPTWVVLADPEGNEFCILTAR